MLKIGITGGIGSGKTTVCKIFETLGTPVYYADERAKWLMQHNTHLKEQVAKLFGKNAYQADGTLNRQHIAGIAFADPEKLTALNALVHPAVGEDGNRWHEEQTNVSYTLREAALIFESGSYRELDKVITVTAPEQLRVKRVMARDNTTEEAVRARMEKQLPETEKVRRADFVIHNDGRQSLIRQVLDIHQELQQLNAKKRRNTESPMKFETAQEILIKQIDSLDKFFANGKDLTNCTLQGLDFTDRTTEWESWKIENTTFLGCTLELEEEVRLRRLGAYIYRAPKNLPYQPFRTNLYTWQELMKGYQPDNDQSTDFQIYEHFSTSKFNPSINEALWQRIHDHSIDDALRELLDFDEEGMTRLKCVGFMGGHGTLRTDEFYRKSALTAKMLTEHGYFIASGGGPGIMEAANLGAYFAGRSDRDLLDAVQVLGNAPHYMDDGYHEQALKVLNAFPVGRQSLAIPTWFYGHEPSNLFASHIAKYFSNSIREDTLLAISLYGIVFAPGSAGTTQEIFMDATQNHYGTFNYYSPMVFLGRQRYSIDTLIYPLVKQLSWGRPYHELIEITDEPTEVLDFLIGHGPKQVVK